MFDVFGRSIRELVQDFFVDEKNFEVNLVLEPKLPDDSPATPRVQGITKFNVAGTSQNAPVVGGGLSLDAFWTETDSRLAASVNVVPQGDQQIHSFGTLAAEQRFGSGARFFAEIAPTGRIGAGAAFYSKYLAFGALSRDIYNSQQGVFNPKGTAWATANLPGVVFGVKSQVDVSQGTPVFSPDFALAIFDPKSKLEDRPAFEIAGYLSNGGKQFGVSYYQHFVIRRSVYNPFEANNVKQIVNYVDIGTEVKVNSETHDTQLAVAGAWQINKSHLVKAKVDNKRLSLCYIFKTWAHPSISVAVSGKYDYKTMKPNVGVVLNLQTTLGGDFEGETEDFEDKIVRNLVKLAGESRRFDNIDPKLGPVNKTVGTVPVANTPETKAPARR